MAAAGAHFSNYGEGERLRAPVFYLARRDTLSPLARRHNLQGFLLPLYASWSKSEHAAQRARLLPVVQKWLKRLG